MERLFLLINLEREIHRLKFRVVVIQRIGSRVGCLQRSSAPPPRVLCSWAEEGSDPMMGIEAQSESELGS